jgi:hypothetical protein
MSEASALGRDGRGLLCARTGLVVVCLVEQRADHDDGDDRHQHPAQAACRIRRVRTEKRYGLSKYERPHTGQCSWRVRACSPQCGQLRAGTSLRRAKISRTSSRVRWRAPAAMSSPTGEPWSRRSVTAICACVDEGAAVGGDA